MSRPKPLKLVRVSIFARWLRAALDVDIDDRTVRRWVKRGTLRGRRMGGLYYVDRHELERLKKAG